MCEQCVAEVEYYLSPLPGWSLVRATKDGDLMKKDDWGLVECNDPTFWWSVTPTPDPYDILTSEDVANLPNNIRNDLINRSILWEQNVELFGQSITKHACINDIYRLVESGKKIGYDPKSDGFEAWLYDRLGIWIMTKKPFTHNDSNEFIKQNYKKYGYTDKDVRSMLDESDGA
jgi:hypothetical protein